MYEFAEMVPEDEPGAGLKTLMDCIHALCWIALAPWLCFGCMCGCCLLQVILGTLSACCHKICGGKTPEDNMTEEEKQEKMDQMKKGMEWAMKMKNLHMDGGPVCSICLNGMMF